MGSFVQDGYHVLILCIACPLLAWIFSFVYYKHTARIPVDPNELCVCRPTSPPWLISIATS